jgi:hypothetical protein
MKRILRLIVLIFIVSFLSSNEMQAQPFRVFAVSDLARVFEDGYNLPVTSDTMKLFGIRAEVISGQCLIQARKTLTNVTVTLSQLINDQMGNNLPDESVKWNFVGSVRVDENVPNQPGEALCREAPGMFPDYLMVEENINIESKIFKSIWLTINIPESAYPGTYNGHINVQCDQGEQILPVQLEIHPFTMPSDRHLNVTEWFSTGYFEEYHGIEDKYSDEWFDMLKLYAENMVAHRQNIFQVPFSAIEIIQSEDGSLDFDFSRFDQIAGIFFSTGKMDYLETSELVLFDGQGWASTSLKLRDFNIKKTETGKEVVLPGEEVVPVLLPAFENHLRRKGWLKKTLLHVRDEPSLHNALAWREMSAYLHNLAPDLKRIDAIETPYVLGEDLIEIAVPKLDAFRSWYDLFKAWSDAGNELWIYTVGIYQGAYLPNKTIDMPLIESRILHWLNYKYDATGYLHWGWNMWHTGDPFNDVGMHVGDGWHVYPKKDGLLNSLRWEQMRNGIQDYEYLWLLENRIRNLKDSLGSRFAWIDPTHRGKEIACSVVMNIKDHTQDPSILNKAKKQVIEELHELNTTPQVYIQTDPKEGTSLTRHSSVAVFGWTVPGTKILINGVEVPVTNQGLFLDQCGGDKIDPLKIPFEDTITVEAIKGSDYKKIIRNFIMEE